MKKLYSFLNVLTLSKGISEPEGGTTTRRSDDPVIQCFLDGDDKAFKQLFDLYAPAIYRVASRFLGSKDLSEEVVGELFSSLRNEPERFDTSTMEKLKISVFERAKILVKRKMGLSDPETNDIPSQNSATLPEGQS